MRPAPAASEEFQRMSREHARLGCQKANEASRSQRGDGGERNAEGLQGRPARHRIDTSPQTNSKGDPLARKAVPFKGNRVERSKVRVARERPPKADLHRRPHARPRVQLERFRVADLPRGEARAVTIQVAALRVTPSAPSHAASARRTGSSALSRRDGASRRSFPNGPTVIITESMASSRYCYDGLGRHSALSAIMGSTRQAWAAGSGLCRRGPGSSYPLVLQRLPCPPPNPPPWNPPPA